MPPETLQILTLSVCLFTLTLATAALLPQLKVAMTLVRDALMGTMFVIALSFAGFLIWGWILQGRSLQRDSVESSATPQEPSTTHEILSEEELDPLPLPSVEDEIMAGNQHRYGAVVSTVPPRPH